MRKELLENVRNSHPLIHNITNYVTVNDCANILLAWVLLAVYKLLGPLLYQLPALPFLFAIIIRNTVYLAVFNLIPIPPLDGSRLLTAILPDRLYYTIMRYERVVMGVMMLALFTGILNLPIGGIADAILLLLDRLTFFL